LRTAGAKALAAQNRASRLGLEWNTVGFTTLIAHDIKALAFASALAGATKVLPASVPAGLTTLGVRQPALAIVILFSLGKRKGRSAFGTGDV
jgi:hypothetical protein